MPQTVPEISANTPLTAEQIRDWLVSQLSDLLAIAPQAIDTRAPLDSYGLDSVQAMSLMSRAEKLLGFSIPPLLLWHYPTIESLSRYIAEEQDALREGGGVEEMEI